MPIQYQSLCVKINIFIFSNHLDVTHCLRVVYRVWMSRIYLKSYDTVRLDVSLGWKNVPNYECV